ncbi:hypothetical protein LTR08_002945 [Meristemomyces frigidus]|nr:hypothetical protein LTR08_002945 [Meristemomyces frigidus]
MSPLFVVRPLPSSGLDGAFRVHLAPESLELLGLKVGDLCQISGDKGGIGYGIAWRALDKMGNSPKIRPAKMTQTLRKAYDFEDGSHVTISRTTAQLQHAEQVVLTDVTPSDYGSAAELENNKWRTCCAYLLVYSDAVAACTIFDVSAKKGLRKRFYVEHVGASGAQAGAPGLFFCDDSTQFSLSGGETTLTEPTLPNGDVFPVLNTSRIGGLVEQVKELNMRMDRILNKSKHPRTAATRHVLLHGYEGTGKSILLRMIAQTRACKVFRIRKVDMTGKIQATIQSTFKDAVASQPSIILMDNIEKLASADNELYADVIGEEMDKLHGSDVLVVAATRTIQDITSTLTDPGRLSRHIELPIPETAARKKILSVLQGQPADSIDPVTEAVGAKTHGFTGKDLARLVEEASDISYTRVDTEKEGWVDVHARHSVFHSAHDSQLDGSVYSQATTQVEQQQAREPAPPLATEAPEDATAISLEDFELALTIVRPTALREIFLETPKVQWSDIGGSETIKQQFDEIIGWPLQHPDLLEIIDVQPQKGILLYGPPGCSKTMTAQAVATTYDLNFIAVKGAELISMYVGESERAVREVFRKARQAAPCIVFFDEIDAIGSERESGGTKGLNVLTTLLNEMDGFEAMKDVLVLAATNKPEVLDPALLRPGRFDQHVYVGLPNDEARKEIMEIALKKAPSDLQFDQCVTEMKGYSGAEVVAVCAEMKRCAIRRILGNVGSSQPRVLAEDFEAAIRKVRKGVTEEMLAVYRQFASR